MRTHRCGREVCMRRARPRRSTTRWHGPSRRAGRWSRCAITNVYGPNMPRDTPYSGVAAIFRFRARSRRRAKGFRGRRADARLRPLPDDVAGATSRPSSRALPASPAFNVCSGRPISILEVATELCEARGDVLPLVTGQYRSGDVRHIVRRPGPRGGVAGVPGRRRPARRSARDVRERAAEGLASAAAIDDGPNFFAVLMFAGLGDSPSSVRRSACL